MSRLSGRTEVRLRAATSQELQITVALIETEVFRCVQGGKRPSVSPICCTEKSHSFRLEYSDGRRFFLKRCLFADAYYRELLALEVLEGSMRVPRLEENFDEIQVLLTEWIPHRQDQDFVTLALSAACALGELHSSPQVRATVQHIASQLGVSCDAGNFIVGDLKEEHILSPEKNVVRFCDLETFSIGSAPLLDLQQLIGLVAERCPTKKSSGLVDALISAYASGCGVDGVEHTPEEIQRGLVRLTDPHSGAPAEGISRDWKCR